MIKKYLGFVILLACLSFSCSSFAEDVKMCYINMRKVFYEYQKTKEFNQNLEKQDERVKSEIEKRTHEIRKMRDEIDLLSEKARAKKQPELREKIKELDDFRKEKIEGFIRQKDTMFKEIRKDILAISSDIAKKNGYEIVFDQAVFVYASEKYDITDTIIKELNK